MNKVTVRDGEEKTEKIGVGSMWLRECEGVVYYLTTISPKEALLVRLESAGRMTNKGTRIKDWNDITDEEWSDLTGSRLEGFTRVYHVEIEAKREG